MRLVFRKGDLLKSTNIVLRAVAKKSSLPILSGILIEATSDNTITFTSNNTELGIKTVVCGTVEEPGEIVLDAKFFSDIVKKLPNNQITVESDSNLNVTITCEKARFTLCGQSGETFPEFPEVSQNHFVVLPQSHLKEMIHQTVFSVSEDESNKIMTGMLLEVNGTDNVFRILSLDGRRISTRMMNLDGHWDSRKIIVPGKSLIEIGRILSNDQQDTVCIDSSGGNALFILNDTMIVSRLIDGNFFAVDSMFKMEPKTEITICKKDLLECAERAMLFMKSERVPFVINLSNGRMDCRIKSSSGSMDEKLSCLKSGDDIKIGLNPKFLLDALNVIDDDEIKIYMVNAKAPLVIRDGRTENNYLGTYSYLILSINIAS